MTTVDAVVERRRNLRTPRKAVWPILSDFPRYGDLVPRVVEYREVEDGWRWVLEGDSPVGVVRPTFTAQYLVEEPVRLSFDSVELNPSDEAVAQGVFECREDRHSTLVVVRLRIHADVPVPSLFAARARQYVEGQLADLVEGFLDNVAREARSA